MKYIAICSIVFFAAAASAQDYVVGEDYAPYGTCTGVNTTSVNTVYDPPPSVSYPEGTSYYPESYTQPRHYGRRVRYVEPYYRPRYYDPGWYRRGSWSSPGWNRNYHGYSDRHGHHRQYSHHSHHSHHRRHR